MKPTRPSGVYSAFPREFSHCSKPCSQRLLSLAPQTLPGLSLESSAAMRAKSSQVQSAASVAPTRPSIAVSYTTDLELLPRLTPYSLPSTLPPLRSLALKSGSGRSRSRASSVSRRAYSKR